MGAGRVSGKDTINMQKILNAAGSTEEVTDQGRQVGQGQNKKDQEYLLYNIENSAQYSIITWMGKELETRIDTCICITESLCYTPETK